MPPHKEVLALLCDSRNLQLVGMMVRKAVKAELAVESSQLMRNEELNPWMMVTLMESWYQVKQEDDQRKSNVQQVSPKSTDFLRRLIPPVEGQ